MNASDTVAAAAATPTPQPAQTAVRTRVHPFASEWARQGVADGHSEMLVQSERSFDGIRALVEALIDDDLHQDAEGYVPLSRVEVERAWNGILALATAGAAAIALSRQRPR